MLGLTIPTVIVNKCVPFIAHLFVGSFDQKRILFPPQNVFEMKSFLIYFMFVMAGVTLSFLTSRKLGETVRNRRSVGRCDHQQFSRCVCARE